MSDTTNPSNHVAVEPNEFSNEPVLAVVGEQGTDKAAQVGSNVLLVVVSVTYDLNDVFHKLSIDTSIPRTTHTKHLAL